MVLSEYKNSVNSGSIARLLLSGVMLLIGLKSHAQMPLDSMHLLARSTVEWEVRKDALIDLSDHHQMRNNDSVFHYTALLEEEGLRRNDWEALFHSQLEQAEAYHSRSELGTARVFYHRALKNC